MTNPDHKCPECKPEEYQKCTLLTFGKVINGVKQPCGAPAVWSSNLGNFCDRCNRWVLEDKMGQEMSNDLQQLINRGKK